MTDRIYELFAEANPAPADAPAEIERPDADLILREERNPTMLTHEPSPKLRPAPQRPRWRGPAIALASFLGAAVLGVAVWLMVGDDGPEAGGPTTLPPATTTTTVTPTTAPPTSLVPARVAVPNLEGLTLEIARLALDGAGLGIIALPGDVESAVVVAQEPAPGTEVDEGSVVTVDVEVTPTCMPPAPAAAPGPGEVTIDVRFDCDNDGTFPTEGIAVTRIVPEQGGEAIDRIEWTLRSLLAGPTEDEKAAGFYSFFDEATADALIGVTLTDGRLVADFNEAIYVNNASTSTGGLFFNAELRSNMFQHPEVDSVEFRINGDCEAWSTFFQSDGCWVVTLADWKQDLGAWDELRDQ